MRQKLRLGPSFRFFESLCSKDSFFSSFFSFTCNHSKIPLHKKNSCFISSSVACIHITFTLVPHKVNFSYKDSTFNYGPCTIRRERHATDLCVANERVSRTIPGVLNYSKLLSISSSTLVRLGSSAQINLIKSNGF